MEQASCSGSESASSVRYFVPWCSQPPSAVVPVDGSGCRCASLRPAHRVHRRFAHERFRAPARGVAVRRGLPQHCGARSFGAAARGFAVCRRRDATAAGSGGRDGRCRRRDRNQRSACAALRRRRRLLGSFPHELARLLREREPVRARATVRRRRGARRRELERRAVAHATLCNDRGREPHDRAFVAADRSADRGRVGARGGFCDSASRVRLPARIRRRLLGLRAVATRNVPAADRPERAPPWPCGLLARVGVATRNRVAQRGAYCGRRRERAAR